jgi:hypothetical protein
MLPRDKAISSIELAPSIYLSVDLFYYPVAPTSLQPRKLPTDPFDRNPNDG